MPSARAAGSRLLPKSLSQLPVHVNQGDMAMAMNMEVCSLSAMHVYLSVSIDVYVHV